MAEFSIRDPILEGIVCSAAEKRLINSPLVQRLKWVSQLSLVNQVYNGATHSRFSHSLGTMHVAGEYMTHLLSHGNTMDADEVSHFVQLARIVGLLHDISHGPYSHSWDHSVFQKIYGIEDGGHDLARLELIKSDLLVPYILACGIDPDELLKVWNAPNNLGTNREHLKAYYAIVRNVVEGPLGADRIDFTRRDAYFTGTQHLGTIPVSRIIQHSRIVTIDGTPRLCYAAKCIEDIIRTLDGRLNMYVSLYLHKTSVAASLLIERMLDLICEPMELVRLCQDPHEFKKLNDHRIFGMISEWKMPDPMTLAPSHIVAMQKAQRLYEQLMDRVLPKMDFEVRVNDFGTAFDASAYAAKWYPGCDPETYIIYKSRPISGICAEKFDTYHIYFYNGGEIKTCQQLLDAFEYTVPIKPFYFVRGYTLSR